MRFETKKRSRGNRQDGNDQRLVQGAGDAVRGFQLLGRPRLHRHGKVFQGAGFVRRLGVLRRVQPDQHRGRVHISIDKVPTVATVGVARFESTDKYHTETNRNCSGRILHIFGLHKHMLSFF